MAETARNVVLKAVRQSLPVSSPLPEVVTTGILYADPVEQFSQVLRMIGGAFLRAASLDELNSKLSSLEAFRDSNHIVSHVEGVANRGKSAETSSGTGRAVPVDFAILPGKLAVAENAAVWVDAEGVPERVTYFLCEHLLLVVPADQLVHNMHQAYQKLQFQSPGFGTFIAGPSKTADIEQSLVIGAHGPKSTTVCLLG